MLKPKATESALGSLHGILCEHFADILMNGEQVVDIETGEVSFRKPSAAVLAQIRQFLKDNKIEASPENGSPLAHLVGVLPKFTDEDARIRH